MRYSISKFRDFSRIFLEFFLNFLGSFLILSIFTKMSLQFFKLEIYKNAPLIFKVKIYRNAPPIF